MVKILTTQLNQNIVYDRIVCVQLLRFTPSFIFLKHACNFKICFKPRLIHPSLNMKRTQHAACASVITSFSYKARKTVEPPTLIVSQVIRSAMISTLAPLTAVKIPWIEVLLPFFSMGLSLNYSPDIKHKLARFTHIST